MEDILDFKNIKDKVEIRKILNSIILQAQNNAKPSSCIQCGKIQTSFCNSHSVPQMSLKAIASKGKLLQSSFLFGLEVVDVEKGVNNSGTFKFICRECDASFFREYENYDALIKNPTDVMIAEIAVKNILLQLSNRVQLMRTTVLILTQEQLFFHLIC